MAYVNHKFSVSWVFVLIFAWIALTFVDKVGSVPSVICLWANRVVNRLGRWIESVIKWLDFLDILHEDEDDGSEGYVPRK